MFLGLHNHNKFRSLFSIKPHITCSIMVPFHCISSNTTVPDVCWNVFSSRGVICQFTDTRPNIPAPRVRLKQKMYTIRAYQNHKIIYLFNAPNFMSRISNTNMYIYEIKLNFEFHGSNKHPVLYCANVCWCFPFGFSN